MILKKYKNELLTIIRESVHDPALFTAADETIAKEKYFVIRLRNSPIRFALQVSSDFSKFKICHSTFSPGFPLTYPHSAYSAFGYFDIKDVYTKFKAWLDTAVKLYLEEIDTPDLWQTLEDSFSYTTRELETSDEFEPFSNEEKIQLKRSIDELRRLIETNFEVQKKELAATNKLLDHLSDAVDEHNKFDWRGIAISVALTIAVHLVLNPEQTRQLFQLFKDAFSSITLLLP